MVGFLVVSGVGALMEDRGMGGRSQSRDHEVTVAQKGDKKFKDVLGIEEAKGAIRVRVRVRVRVRTFSASRKPKVARHMHAPPLCL